MPPKKKTPSTSVIDDKLKKGPQRKVAAKKVNKEICTVCKKKTNLSEDGLKCNICQFQYHAPCLDIQPRVLELIAEMEDHGLNSWKCESCKSALATLEDKVHLNAVEIVKINERMDSNEQAHSDLEEKVEQMSKELSDLKKENEHVKTQSNADMMRSVQAELVEQNSRSKNVVIHGLADNNSADEDMKNLIINH